ncbi:5-carboxymethyl-2-hydroxymuconate Delta-isomerase [Mesoterricola sediminis]|uniref:5-carboxymethyl-2-hydroxymuconate isomerase n=1 Tax=Mesoterricola sediminis TaxID=2927980 RepID=A0AA48GPC6_9BACT|nr:5-carboxymethyl-2-hydroxymuconate Delta-isomerase [Mesoterricola sediminis]BDU76796.1 5-carboxymethyl-2-hydroxymuconate isomerase [Mesoterricola sediminis]
MPHTLLEYTANVAESPDLQAFWERLHRHLEATAPCRIQDIKSRARRCEDFRMGAGGGHAFVHLTIQLMEGRTPETLAQVGQGALALLREAFPRTLAEREADLTVEIRGMRKDSYFKTTSVKAP